MLPYLRRMLGKARIVTPGSAGYTTPGTYSFVVPEYNTPTIDLSGAGGGGISKNYNAASGGPTQIGSLGLVAYGGGGAYTSGVAQPGAAGGASGGDTNITGGGGAGGAAGGSPVGFLYQPGGAGGRLIKTYTYGASGAPVPGTSLIISVGSGGAGGGTGGTGGSGSAGLSWS